MNTDKRGPTEQMDKRGPTEHTECYSAEWLRYEARETQKFILCNL